MSYEATFESRQRTTRKRGRVMKIETAINMAVTAVMCDMRLPQEMKKEIIDGLRECEDLARIGDALKTGLGRNLVELTHAADKLVEIVEYETQFCEEE